MKNWVFIFIAILLAVDNVFIRFRIGSISYDRLLEFLFFFIFFSSYLKELKSNKFFRTWNIFLLTFALLQLLVNFKLAITNHILFEEVYEDFFKCFSFLVFSFLFLLIAKKDIKYINVILWTHLIICIFAFLQHPLSPLAPEMLEVKRFLYSQADVDKIAGRLGSEENYIEGGFTERFRLAGPFVSATGFSYFAITSFILSFYMYIRYNRRFYLIMLIVLFTASVLSQTRSLLLGELFIVFGYLFFNTSRRHSLYKLAILVGGILSISFLYLTRDLVIQSGSRLTNVTGQNDSRPILWLTGIYTVGNNPFGVSSIEYEKARKEVFALFGNPAVMELSTHHGLINLGFHYSIFGYVIFVMLIIFLLRYINKLHPRISLVFKLAMIGYLLNASFHNNFVLNADYPFLMVIMLIYIAYMHDTSINES